MQLRDYQSNVIKDLNYSINNGLDRILLQAATGSGKTVIASAFVRSVVDRGKNVLFLAHRRELINQCSSKLRCSNISHGIIMAGEAPSSWHNVQVASIETLRSRAFTNKRINLPKADYVIIDECHRSLSKTYRKLIESYPNSVVIGLTATPCRSDGLGLGHIYQDMVKAPSIKQLTNDGHLVEAKYFAPSIPDLKGLRTYMGDYSSTQLSNRMDRPKLVGDIVTHWLKIANNKKTVVFASSVKHSIHIKERFIEAGVVAEHIDGQTPTDERDATLQKLENSEIQVICNCMVLTEGWDCPSAEVAVLARPTKSLGLYLQMVGRVLRPYEGKDNAIIIDHSGAVYDHGFVDDEMVWDLDPCSKIQDKIKKRKKRELSPITCEGCFTVYSDSCCPNCGMKVITKGRTLIVGDGELGEVNKKTRKSTKPKYTHSDLALWYSMLLGYARKKGYKDGWAYYKFKDKFGEPPIGRSDPIAPNSECLSWIQHINIKRSYESRRKV